MTSLKQVPVEFSSPIHSKYQPRTNTPAARSMRCAVVEVIIAKVLLDIMQTFHLPGSEYRDLPRQLEQLEDAYKNPIPVVRCSLAKVFQQLVREQGIDIPGAAADAVVYWVKPWFAESSQEVAFRKELEAIFTEAKRLWDTLQRVVPCVKATLALEGTLLDSDEEDMYSRYDEYERTDDATANAASQSIVSETDPRPLAVLFPQVSIDKEVVLFSGYALFPTQLAVKAAATETAQAGNGPRRRRDSQAGGRPNGHHSRSQSAGQDQQQYTLANGNGPSRLTGSALNMLGGRSTIYNVGTVSEVSDLATQTPRASMQNAAASKVSQQIHRSGTA